MNQIYVSYAWKNNQTEVGQRYEVLVDKVCERLLAENFRLIRDKQHLTLGSSITQFMREIGKGNFVLLFLSDKYLRSEYCMFEALEIFKHRGDGRNVFPIILEDAQIYSLEGQLGYAKFWKEKLERYQSMLSEHLAGEDTAFGEVFQQTKAIADLVDDFLLYVKDRLSISPQADFEGFIQSFIGKMKEETIRRNQQKYIYVVGTGAFELPAEILWCTQELGRQIGAYRFNLVVGGWQGVDYVVAASFGQEVGQQGSRLSERLVQVVPQGGQPQFRGGQIQYVEPGPREWLACLEKADVVILIGGVGGTYETYQYATQEQVPVLPIVCTNGDAKRVFDEMLKDWNPKMMGRVTQEQFKSLNQFINSPETAADVVRDVMLMVEELIFSRENLRS